MYAYKHNVNTYTHAYTYIQKLMHTLHTHTYILMQTCNHITSLHMTCRCMDKGKGRVDSQELGQDAQS